MRDRNWWLHVRDELAKLAASGIEELQRIAEAEALIGKSVGSGEAEGPVERDKLSEARDKWIYQQCCKGVAHDSIVRELKKMVEKKKGWRIVSSKQRVQQIGNEYADRHGLSRPPPRRGL